MAKFTRTPEISIEEENIRLKVLTELSIIKETFGVDVLAQILLYSVDNSFVSSSRRWVEQGDGSALRYLNKLGVSIKQNVRQFIIRDKIGTFEFTDDFYYSGINFLLKKYADFFKMPFGVLVKDRLPNSLKPLIVNAGYWDEDSHTNGALNYLVHLHETGGYGDSFVLRMQGGDFKQLRPLVVVDNIGPKEPTYELEHRRHTSSKVLDMCVNGVNRQQWAELILLAIKSDLDNSLKELFSRQVDERYRKTLKNRFLPYVRELTVKNGGLDQFVLETIYSYLESCGLDQVSAAAVCVRNLQLLRQMYLSENYYVP